MMTRRDFAAIAKIIDGLMLTHVEKEPIAQQFADLCAESNPRFDRERFLIACGVK